MCQILKDCPKGTKLWSPFLGEVELSSCDNTNSLVAVYRIYSKFIFYSDGKYDRNGECMLFPSKDQRDWSKFKVPVKKSEVSIKKFNPEEFKPFDKVLVCSSGVPTWTPSFFESLSLIPPNDGYWVVELGTRYKWRMCIPYNDETKHLVGTQEDCPDYYKWWEE